MTTGGVGNESLSAPTPSRALIAIAGVVAAIVLLFVAGSIGLFLAFGCGGDGGVPYAAFDSRRGRFCDSGEVYNTYLAVTILGPATIAIVGAVLGARRQNWRPLLSAMAAGAVLIAASTTLFLGLSSECTEDQVAAGGQCDTY